MKGQNKWTENEFNFDGSLNFWMRELMPNLLLSEIIINFWLRGIGFHTLMIRLFVEVLLLYVEHDNVN